MNTKECEICKKRFPESELITGYGIRHEIEALIKSEYPEWDDSGHICKDDYNAFKMKYVIKLIEEEKGSLEGLEEAVVKSIEANDILTINTHVKKEPVKIGDRIADEVALFGGSWKFIILFFTFLSVWILINSIILLLKPYDPYPFILLNLILSCLAAIQAPIIMMSQNRKETKDRRQAENDYKINLKSEIEIRALHEKVDHLLLDQWSKMMQIQEVQLEVLDEIRTNVEKNERSS